MKSGKERGMIAVRSVAVCRRFGLCSGRQPSELGGFFYAMMIQFTRGANDLT